MRKNYCVRDHTSRERERGRNKKKRWEEEKSIRFIMQSTYNQNTLHTAKDSEIAGSVTHHKIMY